jgi:hypothetical protein
MAAASEKRSVVAPLQLATDNLTRAINAMHLKHRLRDIETDCRNRLHCWLLRIVAAFNSPRIHGTHVPVEEPSTASLPDSCSADISREGEGPLAATAGHMFYEKLTCRKTERVVHFVDGGEVHCALNDPSLKHQIEFDWLDDVFKY